MVSSANIRRLKMKENGSLSKLPLKFNLLAVSDLSENLDDKKSTERTKKLNLEPTPELIVGLVIDDLEVIFHLALAQEVLIEEFADIVLSLVWELGEQSKYKLRHNHFRCWQF